MGLPMPYPKAAEARVEPTPNDSALDVSVEPSITTPSAGDPSSMIGIAAAAAEGAPSTTGHESGDRAIVPVRKPL